MTIQRAAPVLGVTMRQVTWWEGGQYRPTFPSRPELATHLGADIETRWDNWLRDRPGRDQPQETGDSAP